MGIEIQIACSDCFEYLKLHKWFPGDEITKKNIYESKIGKYSGTTTSSASLHKAIKSFEEKLKEDGQNYWIQNLIPHIKSFIQVHGEHCLILYNDLGDMPWHPYEEDWHRWKEIEGPMSLWGENFEDVDLPRNMIDDMGINNWPDALEHYKKNCSFVSDHPQYPTNLELIFNLYLEKAKLGQA